MAVGFRELCQFGFVVNVRIGNLEGTRSTRDVGLDITDTLDFGQIASDRGGTAASEHVRYFQTDKRHGGVVFVCLHNGCRFARCGCVDDRGDFARASDGSQQSNLEHDRGSFHGLTPREMKNVDCYYRIRPTTGMSTAKGVKRMFPGIRRPTDANGQPAEPGY